MCGDPYQKAVTHLEAVPELSYLDRDWDLDNIAEALAYVRLSPPDIPSIQVVGTNGKGTTSYFLAAILSRHGYKTGLYTSPHLVTIRERVQVDGKFISKGDFARLYLEHLDVFEKFDLSYFEKLTFLAAMYFADRKVDYAVLETGLGGKLDAVTALGSRWAVFTSISLDHEQFLGESLDKIATEKAAVLRYRQSAISAPQQEKVKQVLRTTAARYGRVVDFVEPVRKVSLHRRGTSFHFGDHRLAIPMFGRQYAENVSLAWAASERILGEEFRDDKAQSAVEQTTCPGRLDIHDVGNCRWVLSCAHNRASIAADIAVVEQLIAAGIIAAEVDVLCAVSRKRPLHQFIELFPQYFRRLVLTKISPDEELRAIDREGVELIEDPHRAFASLRNSGTILVIGSIYLCGMVLSWLPKNT